MFEAKILADSIANGIRLTTAQITFPRSILAELNTHKMLSKNAASSRAIPNSKLVKRITDDPFIPDFRLNKQGMQAGEALEEYDAIAAATFWLQFRDSAISQCKTLNDLNIHKQYVNRLIEPWMWCTVIITGTDWDNMFFQRCHEAAEPSFRMIAEMLHNEMDFSYASNIMKDCYPVKWHLPLMDKEEVEDQPVPEWDEVFNYLIDLPESKQLSVNPAECEEIYCEFPQQLISAGRCCKVSYLNLDSGEVDLLNDIRLGLFCCTNTPGHWSPLEHQATMAQPEDMVYKISQLDLDCERQLIYPKQGEVGYCGPLKGWKSFRKFFANENHVNI